MKKRIVAVMLGIGLLFAATACGDEVASEGKADSVQTADVSDTGANAEQNNVAEENSVKENRTSEEMYIDFLEGREKVYTEKREFEVWNYESTEQISYYGTNDGFTLNDFIKKVIEVEAADYNLMLDSLSYVLLDCGADGEPELGLQAVFSMDYDMMTREFIIKNVDGKLQLCYQMESYYRSSEEIVNRYGSISSYGSFGAGAGTSGVAFLDANGDYHLDYNYDYNYNGLWMLDSRFEDAVRTVVGVDQYEYWDDDADLYLEAYSFIPYDYEKEDEYYSQVMYCAEPEEGEEYLSGDYEQSLTLIQAVFDEAGVKLYTRAEIQTKLAEQEAKLGLTDEILEYDYPDWIAWENVDIDYINGTVRTTVSSISELMNALGQNTTVVLKPGEYNVTEWLTNQIIRGRVDYYYIYDEENDDFSEVPYDGEFKVYYSSSEEEPQLILDCLQNCNIISEDPSNPAKIVSDPRDCDVLRMVYCNKVNFENIVMGHTDGDDGCSGDVIEFDRCDNITMDGCDLYGCGATALDAYISYNININNSRIHDCSVGCVYVNGSYVYFDNTTFEDVYGYTMFSSYDGGMNFTGCTFRNLSGDFISEYLNGYMTFTNCRFDDELLEQVKNHSLYGENINIYD